MVQIYVIEKNNQPIYVGKTVGFSVRLYYHRKRFGKDITWFFIDEVKDNEWKFWECHYINLFKSWGYKLENKNDGGGGPTKYSEEVRRIISEKKTGMKYNLTQEGKIGKSEKLTGIKRSKETCRLISQRKTNHPCYTLELADKISQNSPFKKKVTQLDINGNIISEFNSMKIASKTTSISYNGISLCCLGINKTAGGFKWKYKN
jgi:hypothetical protein